MKYRINAILPFLISFLITTAAISGDKFKPLSEISPYATRTTITSIPSTGNLSTTSIELPDPRINSDNSLKPETQSSETVDLQKVPTSAREVRMAQEIDNIFSSKQVEVKKPATHKAREQAKKRKKRQTKVKTVRDNIPQTAPAPDKK